MYVCVWAGFVCMYLEVHMCICMHVRVLAACSRVTGPMSLHLLQAELLICTSLFADAHKCDEAIRSTLCWKEERLPCLSHGPLWKCHFPSGGYLQSAERNSSLAHRSGTAVGRDGYRIFGFEGCVRKEKIKRKEARAEYQRDRKRRKWQLKRPPFLLKWIRNLEFCDVFCKILPLLYVSGH